VSDILKYVTQNKNYGNLIFSMYLFKLNTPITKCIEENIDKTYKLQLFKKL